MTAEDAAKSGIVGAGQEEVAAFLARPGSFAAPDLSVEMHETHGARVFIAGDLAIKIKRAVRYRYLDFSTLEKRKATLERELEINRVNAAALYIDVKPITRNASGDLNLAGDGEAVEWCLVMRRFEQSCLLSHIAKAGLDTKLLKDVADEVYRSHQRASVAMGAPVAPLLRLASSVLAALRSADLYGDAPDRLEARLRALDERDAALLERRAAAARFRRCHGDLHLDNIVLWEGRPVLFDALEFDETMATIDVLYDLAFLLMDLDVHSNRAAANIVLNRYLWRSQDDLDLAGLAALPLFLALRAGIRAMVACDRGKVLTGVARTEASRDAERYLDSALGYAEPAPAALIAIGGYSGTGKSTLAAALAPEIGPAPGALHLRSDLERKALAGVDELDRLDASHYGPKSSEAVYAVLTGKARTSLAAGHSVIVDAVFASAREREAIEAVAREAAVPFAGIWLAADAALLKERIDARSGDASDATADVVDVQSKRGAGLITWSTFDAGQDRDAIRRAAIAFLAGQCAIARKPASPSRS